MGTWALFLFFIFWACSHFPLHFSCSLALQHFICLVWRGSIGSVAFSKIFTSPRALAFFKVCVLSPTAWLVLYWIIIMTYIFGFLPLCHQSVQLAGNVSYCTFHLFFWILSEDKKFTSVLIIFLFILLLLCSLSLSITFPLKYSIQCFS